MVRLCDNTGNPLMHVSSNLFKGLFQMCTFNPTMNTISLLLKSPQHSYTGYQVSLFTSCIKSIPHDLTCTILQAYSHTAVWRDPLTTTSRKACSQCHNNIDIDVRQIQQISSTYLQLSAPICSGQLFKIKSTI